MGAEILVGAERFASKAALKRHIRAVVEGYQIGETMREGDARFFAALLERHPNADDKIGAGIVGFRVIIDPEWGRNRQVLLLRIDGTSTDFSWVQCVDGKRPGSDARKALRRAVLDQITAFRDGALRAGARCPYRGVPLASGACHVDHAAPMTFERLVEMFVVETGIALEDVEVTPSRDNQRCAELTNPAYAERWRAFHRQHAVLRLLSPGANTSEARRDAR